MILENESSLQRWLSNQLRPISDADPLALAMYVVALLKHHDKKGDVLKNHCYEQLLDFLKDHTRDFLESLFNVLKDGSYKVEGVDDEFDDEQARGDDDFEDDEDNSRRRDRRRDSDSFDDYDDRRKRTKHESESPTSSQSATQVHPAMPAHDVNIQQPIQYNSSVRENFRKENRGFQESQQRSYVEQERLKQTSHQLPSHQPTSHQQTPHKLPSHQPTSHQSTLHQPTSHQQPSNQQPTHKQTSQQQTLKQSTLHQQTSHQLASHQLASHLPTSHLVTSNQLPSQQQHLVARGLDDSRLMGGFDGMGPETQRAIFGAMGGSMPILLAPQLQQQLPLVSSANRPREKMQNLDYTRAVGSHNDDSYVGGAIGFPPPFGALGMPSSIFPAAFVPLPRAQPSGIQEADIPLPYSNQRPLPPPTDFPGPAKKPAPPSAPPPLPQMQLQQLFQPEILIEQPQLQQQQLQQQQQQQQQQQWRQERGFKNGGQNTRQGQGQGQNQANQHQNSLPDNERCTLKCTGLPQTAKEADLRAHFKTFGRVVELQLIEAEGDKKQYNDCLVQFGTAFEAKKCCNSPTAVLNNRFVRVMFSNFNIVPFADVLPLTADEIEQAARESAAAAFNTRKTKKWTSEGVTAAVAPVKADDDTPDSAWAGTERRAKGVGLQGRGFGVSNKFIANHTMKSPPVSVPLPVPASVSTELSTSASGTRSASASNNEDTEGADDLLYSSIEFTSDGLVPSITATEPAAAAVSVPLTKEDIALQQQYEGLRALRQQADSIWKQKESLLQGQIDQYRIMLEKLESSPDASKSTLLESIEGKIVDLQSLLRSVRDQRETGVVPHQVAPVAYGGRGGRGYNAVRGRGRGATYYPQQHSSSGRGRGRGYEDGWGSGRGQGQGRFGGRGAEHQHPGYLAVDNRTRSIVVFQPPEGFHASAQEHFGRFGEVQDISSTSDGCLTVQFKERRDAESAKAKGAFYNSGVLLLDWQEGNDAAPLAQA